MQRSVPSPLDVYFGFPLSSKALFYRQLATLVNSGSSIGASTKIALSLFRPGLGEETCRLLDQGYTLSQVLGRYPQFFTDYEVAVVKAGEYSGQLDRLLSNLAKELEQNSQLEKSLKAKLVYPILVSHAAVFIPPLVILVTHSIFAYLKATLGILVPIYAVATVISILYRLGSQVGPVRRFFDYFVLWIPLVGSALQLLSATRFLRGMGNLYEAGVLPDQALMVSAQSCGNSAISARLIDVHKRLGNGVPTSNQLQATQIFPGIVPQLLKSGEESGNPSQMLMKSAELVEQEANQKLHLMATVLPMIALFICAGLTAYQVFSVFGGLMKLYKQLM